MTFLTGAALNAAIRYKDVTLDPKKRNSKLQTWGAEDKYHSTLEKVIAWNAYGKEGLGVDHEQWLKEKEAAARNEKAWIVEIARTQYDQLRRDDCIN